MTEIICADDLIDNIVNDNEKQCLIDVQYLMICRMSCVKVRNLPSGPRRVVVKQALSLFSKRDQAKIMRVAWRFLKHVNGKKYGMHYEW